MNLKKNQSCNQTKLLILIILAIATPECQELLKEYAKDQERVVRESCEVALDMTEYEQNNEFQYAKIDVN